MIEKSELEKPIFAKVGFSNSVSKFEKLSS